MVHSYLDLELGKVVKDLLKVSVVLFPEGTVLFSNFVALFPGDQIFKIHQSKSDLEDVICNFLS